VHIIAPNDARSLHSAESPVITQVHIVGPVESFHGFSSSSPLVGSGVVIDCPPNNVAFIHEERVYCFRRPIFGNGDDISFQRVNRRTRGGDLVIFRDIDWPKTEVLNLTFNFVKENDGHRMMELIRISVGDIVEYVDHENRHWEGVIQNPTAELVQTGRSRWTVNLIFEGDLV
jgi:hypothetical protein